MRWPGPDFLLWVCNSEFAVAKMGQSEGAHTRSPFQLGAHSAPAPEKGMEDTGCSSWEGQAGPAS